MRGPVGVARRFGVWLVVALACIFSLAASAVALSPLTWSAPVSIDHQANALSANLDSVSCPSNRFCAAADDRGNVLVSADPPAGFPAWKLVHLDSAVALGTGFRALTVSCASASMCVAGDDLGRIFSSTDPGGGRRAWKSVQVAATGIGEACFGSLVCHGLSCPTASFCAAVDGAGDVLTSTDPTGPAAAWRHVNVDPGGGLAGITCRSASFCLAFGERHDSGGQTGAVFSSTDPTGGASAWKSEPINPTSPIAASCPSKSLCVIGDVSGDVVTSTDPTGGSGAWTVARVDSRSLTGVSCPTVSLCVGVDGSGRVLTSTNPTGGASAWQTYGSEEGIPNATGIPDIFEDVSCSSVSLCVAVDFLGNVAASRQPLGGPAAWPSVHIDGGNVLQGVSCAPQGKLCAVTDDVHTVLTATHPISARSPWSAIQASVAPHASSPISCPAVSLCVALAAPYYPTDAARQIAIGTNPGTRAARWTYVASVFPPGPPGAGLSVDAIGCASRTLCVAFASYRSCVGKGFCFQTGPVEAATTTNPTGGSSAWRVTAIQLTQTDRVVTSASCPTTQLCVAVDSSGQALVSTNPSADTWSSIAIDSTPGGLSSVTCATPRLCAAVDAGGNVLTTTNPAAGTAWQRTHITDQPLTGIACPAVSLCIAVDSVGDARVSTRPTGGYSAWSQADIENNPLNSLTAIACPDVLLCVAADRGGNTVVGLGPSTREIKGTLTEQLQKLVPKTIRRLIHQRHAVASLKTLVAGTLTISLYGIPRSHNPGERRVRIAVGRASLDTERTGQIGLTLVHGTRQRLSRVRLRKLIARVTFTPTGSEPLTVTSTLARY